MSARTIAVLTTIGVAIAAALWLLAPGADVHSPAIAPPADAPTPSAAPVAATGPSPETAPRSPDREKASPRPSDTPSPSQGWRGIALDAGNRPFPGVQVHLIESAANEPLALPLIRQQRLPVGPAATSATGADGTFAIGLPVAQDKVYELLFVAPATAPLRLGGLKLLPNQWFDLGTVTLVPGATVRGNVTNEAGMPVPGAVIAIESGTSFVDAALRALPQGVAAMETTSDPNGHYELTNAPRLGSVRLTAVAQGHARVAHGGLTLTGDAPQQVDFVLPRGLAIRGQVVDAANRPIANAQVEAWPTAATAFPSHADADRDGRFHVQHLAAGTYRLQVAARGFLAHEEPAVAAGAADVVLTLERRATIRVRALTPQNAVLHEFHLCLRRILPERGDVLAFVGEVPEQRVRLDAASDFAEVDGVPTGTFVCQVTADGFAPTFSSMFEIRRGDTGRDVDVVVTPGATLVGQVVDENGAPLRGATVTTAPDGAMPDSPVWRMLATAAPARTTEVTTTTDGNGAFVLPRLAFADYQLEIQHPEACPARLAGVRLDRQETRTLAAVRLQRGALVTGRATIGGRTASQLKIVLTSPSNGAGRDGGLRIETLADADGFFRLPRRVPPGNYELRAAVVDTADPEAHHFQQLQQLQRSMTTVTVTAGQDRVEHDIDLPNDH